MSARNRFLIPFACAGIALSGGNAGADDSADKPLSRTPFAAPRAAVDAAGKLFAALGPEKTGIDPEPVPVVGHRYGFLSGSGMEASGVAVGDLDGNGLPDVFLSSSPGNNRIYRQVRPLKFEDVTDGSGIDTDQAWSRGASIVDIDSDGDLDIYVANYAQANCLYINQGAGPDGGPRFVERAHQFGLDIIDASLMPSFCDYDGDGDLDLYLVTGEFIWPGGSEAPPDQRKMVGERDGRPVLNAPYDKFFRITEWRKAPSGGGFLVKWDKSGRPDFLLRNEGGKKFSVVTESAGVEAGHGRGLSATWWDYNDDGLIDLYVGNDWGDQDFLYHNNGDGTFRDVIKTAIPSTSMFSMGSDASDLNNDGMIDFMVADMSGTTHYKRKISMGAMEADTVAFMTSARPPQNMRNAVFLGTGTGRLMEAAYLLGLANSDWTWSVQLDDLDNDGHVDVFVTNGMEQNIRQLEGEQGVSAEELFHEKNIAFRNLGGLRFESAGAAWGLDHYGFSLASVNCDFDRDGDLDIFVVHRGEKPTLYENRSSTPGVSVGLRGRTSNPEGIGAKILAQTSAGLQSRQIITTRGYLGSSEPRAHFGLGEDAKVAKLVVEWPSGHRQEFSDLPAGYAYQITEPEGDAAPSEREAAATRFSPNHGIGEILHRERDFDDFAVQPLLPNKLSQLGPGIALGDIDGDGDEDFVLGGAAGQPTQILLNSGEGKFEPPVPLTGSESYEDMGLLLFDADGDGDRDLYAVSGGVESRGPDLRDRLYMNDGAGGFSVAAADVLPEFEDSGGPAVAADFDRDGDLDLFVGGRVVPGDYPSAPASRLLLNNGGRFREETSARAADLLKLGMVTGATASDIDGDGWIDLIIALEWGPVSYFRNVAGKLVNKTSAAGLDRYPGWWNGVATGDFDRDGKVDIVATNFGYNTKYHASAEHPALIYYGDFGPGKKRVIEAEFEGDTLFPVRGKSCSTRAIPKLAEKFGTFHSFALADLAEIYTPPAIRTAQEFSATTLASGVFLNRGEQGFEFRELPRLAQIAPSFGVVISDFDGDANVDILLAQNFYTPQPETGRMSGGLGLLLQGNGDGDFSPLWPRESGISIPEDAKGACASDLNGDGWPDLLISSNNGPVRAFLNEGRQGVEPPLRIRLQGAKGNPAAVGARVEVVAGDGKPLLSEIGAGSGYLSQGSADVWIAPGASGDGKLRVRWPDGSRSEHRAEPGEAEITIPKGVSPGPGN